MKLSVSNHQNFHTARWIFFFLFQTSCADQAFFSSLEVLHTLGIEQYIAENNVSNISFGEICKKLDQWNFTPGVLRDNIHTVKQMLNINHYCSISIDAFPVQPMIQFDSISELFTGFVAPLSSEMRLAKEVVVFFVQGFDVEWKCLAGYMMVNLEEDGWAVWHTLNQMILLLASYNFNVINVVFGDGCEFDILDNNVDEKIIRGDSIVQHPQYKANILCFAKSVNGLIRSICECIVQNKFHLPDDILEKYELTENTMCLEHLHILIGGECLSTESIVNWLLQKNREFPDEDKMPALKNEIFILRMLWMWVNAMTFVLDDDTSGFYSVETHAQTLRDTSGIFEVMERNSESDELLWSNVRRTTLSALALYEYYVVKGLISRIKYNSFRCLPLHHLKSQVNCQDLVSGKPKPCTMLQFLRLVNSAILTHSNFAVSDFENGSFFAEFLKYRRITVPDDIEGEEDLSDMSGLGLYYLSSRVVSKLITESDCDKCRSAVVTDSVNDNIPRDWIIAVDKMGFLHPSTSVYDVLQWAESLFVHTDEDIFKFHKPCTQFAYRVYGELAFGVRSTFPSCHDILRNVLTEFMGIRLKMVAADLSKKLTDS